MKSNILKDLKYKTVVNKIDTESKIVWLNKEKIFWFQEFKEKFQKQGYKILEVGESIAFKVCKERANKEPIRIKKTKQLYKPEKIRNRKKKRRWKGEILPHRLPSQATGGIVYSKYIVSESWKNFTKRFYKKNKKECASCSGKTEIDIHHMTYERLGHELMEDVVALCNDCHFSFHERMKERTGKRTKKVMTFETAEFIEEVRQSLAFPVLR